MDNVVHDDAAVLSNVLDQLNDLHDDETKAQGTALEMDNVVHDDAAVLSNVLDQLNEVADKQQTSATSWIPTRGC